MAYNVVFHFIILTVLRAPVVIDGEIVTRRAKKMNEIKKTYLCNSAWFAEMHPNNQT